MIQNKFPILLCGLALSLGGCEVENAANSPTSTDQQQTYKWRMVTAWPPNSPGLGTAANDIAELIGTMSNGRLTIKVYGAGELVPPFEVFDTVSSGSVEMGHAAAYYWRGRIPQAQFFSAMPFGMTTSEQNAWLYHGGGLELWREIYEPFNLTVFPAGNTGPQWGGWFRKKLHSADDLNGLIMRIPGLAGEVMSRLHAQQAQLPGSEIFTALETGTIDAAEWVNPFADTSMGFHQIAPYYYYPGWQEASVTLELTINKEAWDTLPADLQAMVRTAAKAVNDDVFSFFNARNPRALEQLIAEKGVTVLPLPDDLLDSLRHHSYQAIQELAASNPAAAKVYKSWSAFLEDAIHYRQYTEDTFTQWRQPSDEE